MYSVQSPPQRTLHELRNDLGRLSGENPEHLLLVKVQHNGRSVQILRDDQQDDYTLKNVHAFKFSEPIDRLPSKTRTPDMLRSRGKKLLDFGVAADRQRSGTVWHNVTLVLRALALLHCLEADQTVIAVLLFSLVRLMFLAMESPRYFILGRSLLSPFPLDSLIFDGALTLLLSSLLSNISHRTTTNFWCHYLHAQVWPR